MKFISSCNVLFQNASKLKDEFQGLQQHHNMSIFDKLFGNRNRSNSNESVLTSETEPFCFRSSHLSIPKEQIRFILFRECDKRGRKLLFDSNSVEKVTLPSEENMCNQKCQQQNEKVNDFIETHKTHAYKYKKPSKEVSSLGEMVFGSVAVIYRGENSCKIHSIPSPKRLMFTTIVSSPSRCPTNTISELNFSDSRESSMVSLGNNLKQQLTVSSDSKLYSHEGTAQKYSATYPWIKQSSPFKNVKQCCEEPSVHQNLYKKSFFNQSKDLENLEDVCLDRRDSNGCRPVEVPYIERDDLNFSGNNLCLCQKNSDCEWDSSNNCDSSGITLNDSENLSSFSGSLSSLKRRWIHSYSTSLDSATFDDTSSSSSKRRTKLGLALVLDLSNTLENEIEKLLFNHTIIIESAMSKLQSCVELAYIKNECFVDIIYEGFLDCQQNIHKLITGGKLEVPMWCLSNSGFGNELRGLNPCEKNMETDKKLDFVNNLQLKFLVNFCDVLAKFDTKDTNFFISTLLTAVLTHHLSWITSIAETDLKYPNEKLSVINGIRPYNPIWAQMNDLCGLLGSPLKSAKTVVTGSAKSQVAAIIKVLSYFIRCNNVTENFYEIDVEDVVGDVHLERKQTQFDSSGELNVGGESPERKRLDARIVCEIKAGNPHAQHGEAQEKWEKENFLLKRPDFNKTGSEGGLKRTKSYLSHGKMEDMARSNELYPDIKNMAESEHINVADLNCVENERAVLVENFLSSEKLKEKIQKMIRVPSKTIMPSTEKFISLGGGYDTVDLAKTDSFKENRVQMEIQRSAPERRKENIVFLLGENEELVNLQKRIVVNKSSFVNMEKENSGTFPTERNGNISDESAGVDNESDGEENGRTLENLYEVPEKTFREHCGGENAGECFNAPMRTPYVLQELRMPRISKPHSSRRLDMSSVMGGVNEHYNSEQVIQGVLEPKSVLEQTLQKDLLLCAYNPVLEKNVKEALCILGDMESWEVSVLSSSASGGLGRDKRSGIRVGMSQLVADMLESFQYLHMCSLPPSFCLEHIEKKLREIYLKSKTVAELLSSTELCSIEYLTTKLDIGINDVPLLLSVATTHSPQIAEKYALSFS